MNCRHKEKVLVGFVAYKYRDYLSNNNSEVIIFKCIKCSRYFFNGSEWSIPLNDIQNSIKLGLAYLFPNIK